MKVDGTGIIHNGICWESQTREGDSQMTLLEQLLLVAAHLGCAVAKEKVCASISAAQKQNVEKQNMFWDIAITSGACMCVFTYVHVSAWFAISWVHTSEQYVLV